jgi:hypothetical protein
MPPEVHAIAELDANGSFQIQASTMPPTVGLAAAS